MDTAAGATKLCQGPDTAEGRRGQKVGVGILSVSDRKHGIRMIDGLSIPHANPQPLTPALRPAGPPNLESRLTTLVLGCEPRTAVCASAAAVWSRTGCSPKLLLCTSTSHDLDIEETRSGDIFMRFYEKKKSVRFLPSLDCTTGALDLNFRL